MRLLIFLFLSTTSLVVNGALDGLALTPPRLVALLKRYGLSN